MVSDALRHCWDEFRDTLHGQKQVTTTGTLEVNRWRATAMANGFFTEQALVDSPLRIELYKHLPGILTGIGIIGTFSGLILGLQAFGQVNLGDAEQARLGLRALLGTVGEAFVISGAAIALAMALTTIEKTIINHRYTELDALCGLIDSLFDAGAGEEYLQRLVEASETSATQTMQMKESLVTDLKQVLTELTQQQIATITASSSQLGLAITSSLNEGLKEPLARISDAVQAVSGNQGDAVNKLMTDVLTTFTAEMQGMFGGQLRGMSEMLTQTASTIQLASQRFEQLASHVQQAGSSATDAMAQRMDDALKQMQTRQTESNEQMLAFMDQLRQNAAKSQSESAELTMSMMKDLGTTTGTLVKGLQDQTHQAQDDQASRQFAATQQLSAFLGHLQDNMSKSQGESAQATTRLLKELGVSTGDLVTQLQKQADAAQVAQTEHQQTANEHLRGFVGDLRDSAVRAQVDASDNTGRMVRELSDASATMVGNLQDQSSKSAHLTMSMMKDLSDSTSALVKGLQDQTHHAQSDQAARQLAATEQMSTFLRQLQENMSKSQGESAQATTRLLKELGLSTDGVVTQLQNQADAAQLAQTQRQQTSNDQMRGFVEELRETAVRNQTEAGVNTGKMVRELSDASANMVRSLQEQSNQAHQANSAQQVALAAQTAELLGKQSEQLTRLANVVQQSQVTMRDTVERIKASTDSHLKRMDVGAERLHGASERLADNLGAMKASSDGLNGSADRLNNAASLLTTALTSTQQVLGDHHSVRDALKSMVAELRSVVENATREAAMTSSLVTGLEQASRRLSEAQVISVTSLEQATQAIGEAHGAFAKQVEVTLREGNRVFHVELAQATGLLKGAIQDLGDVLENLPISA